MCDFVMLGCTLPAFPFPGSRGVRESHRRNKFRAGCAVLTMRAQDKLDATMSRGVPKICFGRGLGGEHTYP